MNNFEYIKGIFSCILHSFPKDKIDRIVNKTEKNKVVNNLGKYCRKTLKVNDLSLPVYFNSENKSEGIPILFYKDKEPAIVYNKELNSIISSVDFISSAYYLITLEYEKNIVKEKSQRIKAKNVDIKDDLKLPLVNYYAKVIKELINYLDKKEFVWESEEKLSVFLTHDIDYISSWRTLVWARSVELLLKFKIIDSIKTFSNIFTKKNPFIESFKRFKDIEEEVNAKSIYFFLTESDNFLNIVLKKKGSVFIERRKDLFKSITDNNDEIGLHGSYKSYINEEQILNEKFFLEKHTNNNIISNRQHYLRQVYPKSWEILESAGILYDYTLGYPDMAIFRGGISTPFHPIVNGKILKLLVIPLNFMDRTFSKYKKLNTTDELNRIKEMTQHLKFTGGVLSILWHNSTVDKAGFKDGEKIYCEILKYLYSENAIFLKSNDNKLI